MVTQPSLFTSPIRFSSSGISGSSVVGSIAVGDSVGFETGGNEQSVECVDASGEYVGGIHDETITSPLTIEKSTLSISTLHLNYSRHRLVIAPTQGKY